ncbi:hypothetical protein [sulfur-oxidizing endosymbiont of Gigantopelta aegis]|uniref:hypothetical protein n=1 Tax=sulfur-oxidizing endosymbiont of Gigantopelta aegis TaxID=2794934 RepID=UPI0018DC4D78|nr:hypothetical protein [sulfur-oxidizing endosymbiont of Gigantopelta aegis]
MKEDEIINEIIKCLELELPDKYFNFLEEFKRLVSRDLLRASYNILDELKEKKTGRLHYSY